MQGHISLIQGQGDSEREIVNYLPSLMYHECVFEHKILGKNGIFPKCHWVVDGRN